MFSNRWLKSWFRATATRRAEAHGYRPKLETLEDRTTPSTFLVTNFSDDFGATGTLRAAIDQANANPGADAITFKNSLLGLISVSTIRLRTTLIIRDTVSINGTLNINLPGFPPVNQNLNPGIEIVGPPANSSVFGDGVSLDVRANGCTFRGLIVRAADERGIILNSNGNTIRNCFIGTTADGAADGGSQGIGILIRGSNNIIGGPNAADRNVISGNASGVVINSSPGNGLANLVQGNLIGADVTGFQDVHNNVGIIINGNTQNTLVVGNVISANSGQGIVLNGPSVTGNVIRSNRIGVAADGVTSLGNGLDGILVNNGAHDNLIGGPALSDGNIIGFSARRGVLIGTDSTINPQAGAGNQLQNNIIFGGFPIDLGFLDFVTPNDPLDADTGPNNLQNSPTLATAVRNATSTTVTGSLSSQPNRNYRIEVISFTLNSIQDERILGSFTVATDASGVANFTQTFGVSIAGSHSLALATDLATNDSSEFSNDIAIDTAPMIVNDALTPEINEGAQAILSGQLVDPDKGDRLSLLVNWGDGAPLETFHPRLDPFAVKHLYEDDGTYNVQFTWVDAQGASNTRTRQVVVHNVAPDFQHLVLSSSNFHVGQQLVLQGQIVEPGADELTLTVDWGDGATDTLTGSDLGKFQFKHRYSHAGDFAIQLTVSDDDGGSNSETLLAHVT